MLVSYHSCIFRGFLLFFTEILPWVNINCNVGLFSFGLNDKEEHVFPCPFVLTLAQFVTQQKRTVFCWVGGSGLGDRSPGTLVSPAEVAVGRRRRGAAVFAPLSGGRLSPSARAPPWVALFSDLFQASSHLVSSGHFFPAELRKSL